jgi:hypothetical protein
MSIQSGGCAYRHLLRDRIPKAFGLDAVRDIQVLRPMNLGERVAAHDTVRHSDRQSRRGSVHAYSAEGFNDHVHRAVAGAFHHINPHVPTCTSMGRPGSSQP